VKSRDFNVYGSSSESFPFPHFPSLVKQRMRNAGRSPRESQH
jgi:hypothetical protein